MKLTVKSKVTSKRDLEIFILIASNQAIYSDYEELFRLHRGLIDKLLPEKPLINSQSRSELVRTIFNNSLISAIRNYQEGKYDCKYAKFSTYMYVLYGRNVYKEVQKAKIHIEPIENCNRMIDKSIQLPYEQLLEIILESINQLPCNDAYKAAFYFLLTSFGSKDMKVVAHKFGLSHGAFRQQYSRYTPQIKFLIKGALLLVEEFLI